MIANAHAPADAFQSGDTMISTLMYLTLSLGVPRLKAATCAPDLAELSLGAPEILTDGTYWTIAGRLNLFWDRRPDRRQAVTLSWDARAKYHHVEAFVARVAGSPVTAHRFAALRTTEPNLDLGRSARMKRRLGRALMFGSSSAVRFETTGPNAKHLVVWATVPHTEESLGVEVPARRLLSDPEFAAALKRLVMKTIYPAASASEVERLFAALKVGLGHEARPSVQVGLGHEAR